MVAISWPALLVVAYLYGSLSFAVILTRAVAGMDIRTLGNRNPGAANVGRSLGTGWGALVLILDISKSVLPMIVADRLLLESSTAGDSPAIGTAVLLTVGVAAVIGHCRPVFYGFRGGGGIATSIGVYVMLVPVEALFCLFAAAGIVTVFVRNVEHRLGPYTPVVFVASTPFVSLATWLFVDIQLLPGIGVGTHGWADVVAVLALSLTILALNPSHITDRMRELRSRTDP